MNTAVQRVVVAGGGAPGWIAAMGLQRAFRHRQIEVTLVDTGTGDAPVGRWTLPSQRGFHTLLGIREPDLVQRTGASYKLASEHLDWQGEGSRFLHAHGDIGTDLGGIPFYKFLLLEVLCGRSANPEGYSVAALAARRGRFARPTGEQASLTASFTYGFHLQETAYLAYLREHALRLGVRAVKGAIADVRLSDSGSIAALRLAGGEEIAGDLFVDCAGAQAPLLSAVSAARRVDWSQWLPCDRMLSALAPPATEPAPVMQTKASDAGWLWSAPLARHSMAGYVYASAFTSDDAALARFRQHAPRLQGEPQLTHFSAGRREKFWQRNCVALGAAAVELEPLAGADLHLTLLGLATLIELFPLDTVSAVESIEYSRVMVEYADALRDFTLAHYRAGPARTGEFWAAARARPAPGRLAEKLELYCASGRINLLDHESFEETDWAWLLLGSGCVPDAIELQIRTRLEKLTAQEVAPLRAHIDQLAASMPRLADYLQRQAAHANRAVS